MNRVNLIGRITLKPELRYTNSQTAYTRFTLAVNRKFTNENGEKETDFIPIVAWRKQAENVCQYLDKGSQVAIEGRIQTGSYKDKDGNNRYTFDVVAETVQFLESKKNGQADNKITPEEVEQYRKEDNDPFASFQDIVSAELDDNFLD